jgi:WhiB family redox-sensing transcriptional regulator
MTYGRTSHAPGLAAREGSPDWRHRAACHDVDPELFFPVGVRMDAVRQTKVAQAVCMACPVRRECLTWAMDSGQEYGVWGSLSENQRRALKRRDSRARTAAARI